ncbi:MAG TPA: heparinase, partial [Burkholderiales bacterium]|nr:heparinase [Burkholderiales bacterium]
MWANLARWRAMTPAEMGYRVMRAVQARAERARLGAERPVPPADLAYSGNAWIKNPNVKREVYVAAAERIADGWLDVFALREVQVGTPPRWNRDPKSGIEAPLTFGKLLDTGDTDLVGDIKYLWQPNRHAQLVTLAQAHALTRKRVYFDALQEQLESWFLACPYGAGANWSSALEAGV